MPLATARQFGFNLSRTLMTVIILIRTPKGYQAIPLSEYDGSPDLIVAEYDPFARDTYDTALAEPVQKILRT